MTWNTIYYGVEKPSLMQKLMSHSILFAGFSIPFSLVVDFVPNELMKNIGYSVTIIISVLLTGFSYWRVLKKPTDKFIKLSFIMKFFWFLLFPLIPFFMCWVTFIYSVPAIYTMTFGHPYEVSGTFEKEYSHRSRGCDYRIKSKVIDNAFPSFVCISENFYKKTDSDFLLVGKQSILGEYYDEVHMTKRIKAL